MKIKKATKKDIPKIIQLFKTCFSSAWKKTGRKFHPLYVSAQLKKALEKDLLVKIEKTGELIAFGWAGKQTDFLGNRFGEIKLVLVHPDYQNKKIGTILLKVLEKRLKTKDWRLFVLSFNKARKLYKEHGYVPFGLTFRKKN